MSRQTTELETRVTHRKPFPWHIIVFLAPAALVYTLFMIYPLAGSVWLSFFTQSGSGVETFVGLQNYVTLFTNDLWAPQFWNAFIHNVYFFLIHFFVQNPIGLLLASLLTAATLRFRGAFRTIYFLPTLLSFVIVGFIWQLILSPIWGVAKGFLDILGLSFLFQPWLGKPETALTALGLISVWQFVGIPMLLFYAALISIPEELVEAARVVEYRSIAIGANVLENFSDGQFDRVVCRVIEVQQFVKRGQKAGIAGRKSTNHLIAPSMAEMTGCSRSRFIFSAAWLTTSREEMLMISSTSTSLLAFSVAPDDTRSTMASARPASGASSIEP